VPCAAAADDDDVVLNVPTTSFEAYGKSLHCHQISTSFTTSECKLCWVAFPDHVEEDTTLQFCLKKSQESVLAHDLWRADLVRFTSLDGGGWVFSFIGYLNNPQAKLVVYAEKSFGLEARA
jgi:hypothetical protein